MHRNLGMSLAMVLGTGILGSTANGADVNRKICAEFDPEAPASAQYEQQADGVTTSKYGGNVDFNMGGNFSTGPELWVGNFMVKGQTGDTSPYLRTDLFPGESEKLEALRFRWNFTMWEQPQSMRGWYLKTGYSYTHINGTSNMFLDSAGGGSAPNLSGSPSANTTMITDERHGVIAGFGNRWMFAEQKFSVTVGASATATFKRELTANGVDPNAIANYSKLIETLPDTRMSAKPLPEADLSMGYVW